MRVVLQRVSWAKVTIENQAKAKIKAGLLILAGFEDTDTIKELQWMANKIVGLRIFNDAEGKMNLSIQDINGDILLVSQFTLYAQVKKGNRPSYIKAAKPEIAIPLYEEFKAILEDQLQKPIQTGEFGADMKVELLNDGPVTIYIDSLSST